MILTRLENDRQQQCTYGHNCPQILAIDDGDFAVVGQEITEEAMPAMPPGPGVGPKERIIRVPRKILTAARANLLAA